MAWPDTWCEGLPELLRASTVRAVRRPNPGVTPELLMGQLGAGPAALLDGVSIAGRKTTLVAWDPLWRQTIRGGCTSALAGPVGAAGPLGASGPVDAAEATGAAESVGAAGPPRAPDPLDVLQAVLQWLPRDPEWPLGVISVLGHDALSPTAHSGEPWPNTWFLYPGCLVAFEKEGLVLVVAGPATDLQRKLASIEALVAAAARAPEAAAPPAGAALVGASLSAEAYAAGVRRIRAAIGRGDLDKAVLSIRFDVATGASPLAVYRRYAAGAPGALRFCLHDGEATLLGVTPELLVRLEQGHCVMRPLAGTRRRGQTAAEDTALLANLQGHPKDAHEHLVAVAQCERDLGAVCEPSTVRVTERLSVEIYPRVMHLASQVEGRLRRNATGAQLVRACFPAGTVAGVPRAPALRLLRELEPVARGPYGGSVGYWLPGDDLQLFLSIRCLLLSGGLARVQTGAGIVAGSDPESEYRECWLKASGALRALGVDESLVRGYLPGSVPEAP